MSSPIQSPLPLSSHHKKFSSLYYPSTNSTSRSPRIPKEPSSRHIKSQSLSDPVIHMRDSHTTAMRDQPDTDEGDASTIPVPYQPIPRRSNFTTWAYPLSQSLLRDPAVIPGAFKMMGGRWRRPSTQSARIVSPAFGTTQLVLRRKILYAGKGIGWNAIDILRVGYGCKAFRPDEEVARPVTLLVSVEPDSTEWSILYQLGKLDAIIQTLPAANLAGPCCLAYGLNLGSAVDERLGLVLGSQVLARVARRDPPRRSAHDIGGTIVKQVLIEAAKPTLVEDYDDTAAWESAKEAHRRIATLSTAIIFLGCPHKCESIDVLQDELRNLISLPGPDVRNGIIAKVKNLSHQVDKINTQFLDSRLFSRLVSINVFYLQQSREHPLLALDTTTSGYQNENCHQETWTSTEHGIHLPSIEFPSKSAFPFSRYTPTMHNTFELDSRYRQDAIDHLGLVRGDEGVSQNVSWVAKFADRFKSNYYPLKINHDLIHSQTVLLYLAPPTRTTKLHMDLGATQTRRLPFVNWVISQPVFKRFQNGLGPQVLHIQDAEGDSGRTAMHSQHLYAQYEGDCMVRAANEDRPTEVTAFYFEFQNSDSRYNNIRSMIIAFINEMTWRYGQKPENVQTIRRVFESMEYYRSWSLPHLFRLFMEVRQCAVVRDFILFLGCFDNCLEEERRWFLSQVLEEQSHSELRYRLVITTSGPDSFLKSSIPDTQVLPLWNCPVSLKGYAVDEEGVCADGLRWALQDVFVERPTLRALEGDLMELIRGCQQTPHLGWRILDWLKRSGRGASIADISATIEKLHPVTSENVLRVFLGNLSLERRKWALLVYHWVKYAMEPLTMEALSHALATSAVSHSPSLLDLDYEQLVLDLQRVFSGIIVVDGCDVKFSHESFYHTATPSLDGCDEQPAAVHGLISETCLKFLAQDEMQQRYYKLSVENYGGDTLKTPLVLPRDDLLEYAVRFWAEHYRLAGTHRPHCLALHLFRTDEARNKWAEGHYLLSNPFTRIQRSYVSPLPYMAALGLEDLVSEQLENEKCLQKDIWLAIVEAARNGHKSILRDLLARVYCVRESELRDAVSWAASSGNEGILDELLEEVASIPRFSLPKSMLSTAAALGRKSLVLAIVRAGHDLGEMNDELGERAIHTAILWGQRAIVRLLLDFRVDPSARDRDGRTPLLLAVRMGNPEIVQMLLNKGASVHDNASNGVSLVNTSISCGAHKILRHLLSVGADFRTRQFNANSDELRYPIIHAAAMARPECLRVLLGSGADPFTESKEGSVLYLACREAQLIDICRLLLDKGADPNQFYPNKEMLLYRALRSNSKELVGLLIDRGARLDVLDTYEDAVVKTPLSFATATCSVDMLEFLLDKGASVNYTPNGVESALFTSGYRQNQIEKAELLLRRGADVNWKSGDGWTALQGAYDMPAFVSLLLKYGADINAMGDCGTVTMMAARMNFKDTLQTLISHNPPPDLNLKQTYDPEDENYGNTALDLAVKYNNYECATLLVEAGTRLEAEMKDAGLILESVDEDEDEGLLELMQISLIQLLIDAGASIDRPNTFGLTPLAVAVEHGNVAVARLLISKGARANIYSPNFGSLLHLACHNRDMEQQKILQLMRLLLETKVGPNAPGPNPSRDDLLFTMLNNISNFRTRRTLARFLIEKARVKVNVQYGSWAYPITVAAQEPDPRLLTYLMRYLIRHGADVNVADFQGRRAVHYVALIGNSSLTLLRLLARAGADLQAPDNYGRTPLHFAAGYGNWPALEGLLRTLSTGYDVNVKDADGWTPLMWACKFGPSNSLVVHELVNSYGADVQPRGYDGQWSAFKLACVTGMGAETKAILNTLQEEKEAMGSDEAERVWEPAFQATPSGAPQGVWCDGCILVRSCAFGILFLLHDR
ncbi:ankyrin repeat [Fusarium albosuccineum]|uniref:Ankyrin repeat n=1 Tax=Fusarium albosuccineum TaxID=1237068 RepID=A0A8H4LAT0_9HYPO|nr:ankyrin repeat [Fusarium albosuccineum]